MWAFIGRAKAEALVETHGGVDLCGAQAKRYAGRGGLGDEAGEQLRSDAAVAPLRRYVDLLDRDRTGGAIHGEPAGGFAFDRDDRGPLFFVGPGETRALEVISAPAEEAPMSQRCDSK